MKYQEIIDYLKTQESELKVNDFDSVYKNISPSVASYLTKFFLDNGIDPLKYLTEVPFEYSYKIKEYYNDKIIIPNNIKVIHQNAFIFTDVKEVYISASVERIQSTAFISSSLEKIHIDGFPIVDRHSFFKCKNVQIVEINSSENDWYDKCEKLRHKLKWNTDSVIDEYYVKRFISSGAELKFLK